MTYYFNRGYLGSIPCLRQQLRTLEGPPGESISAARVLVRLAKYGSASVSPMKPIWSGGYSLHAPGDGGKPSCQKCLVSMLAVPSLARFNSSQQSSASYCFYLTPKKRGRASQNSKSPEPLGDLNASESHVMSLSSAPDQLHYGANSSTSSISGIDQLLGASTMATPFGQISSHDEMWNPVTNSHFSSPEAVGTYPAELVASPGSSVLDHSWNSQLYSVSNPPMLSFGKSSATEWSQFQQPPQPLDERFRAVGSNSPSVLHSCIAHHSEHGKRSGCFILSKSLFECELVNSLMIEELQDHGAIRAPAHQLDFAGRAMRWIIVLQRFNSEVIDARQPNEESAHTTWGANAVQLESMGIARPRSGVLAKLLTFEMALWSYGRMLDSKSSEPYLEKAENAVAQLALEVLQILVEVDSSLAGSDGSFDQLVISSFCITAAYAHLLPDSVTVFK
ncbi:hypothetical protein CSOJ01_14822, partial [Colletotrichum sojae]